MHSSIKIVFILSMIIISACSSSKKSKSVNDEKSISEKEIIQCTDNSSGTYSLCTVRAKVLENNFIPSLFFMVVDLRSMDVVFSEKVVKAEVSWESNEVILINQAPPVPVMDGKSYGYRLNIITLEKNYFNKTNALEERSY